jgi:hypothetical protein
MLDDWNPIAEDWQQMDWQAGKFHKTLPSPFFLDWHDFWFV